MDMILLFFSHALTDQQSAFAPTRAHVSAPWMTADATAHANFAAKNAAAASCTTNTLALHA